MIKVDNRRKYSGGGPRPDLTEIKRKESAERQKEWSNLTLRQQLETLDRRLGKGVGAAKQRARILNGIEKSKQQPVPEPKKVLETITVEDGNCLKAKDRRALERKKRPSK